MNRLLKEKYISVRGRDAALNIAAELLSNNYQVMIQLEDCNIYIVSFTDNDLEYGGDRFALVTDEQEDKLIFENEKAEYYRLDKKFGDVVEDDDYEDYEEWFSGDDDER